MTDFQLALASLILGGALSAATSWYFFRKSVDKRLSAYIQFASPVLGRIDDPEVRKALEIRYRGVKIDDLLQLQFVIANEGQRSIRDLLEPLSITLPTSAKLLEATVLHVDPPGREVSAHEISLADGRTKVEFRFKLLNKGEFFFIKMLINGALDSDVLKFNISVDDLPPTITPRSRPFRAPDEEPKTGIAAIILGLAPLSLAAATVHTVLELSRARAELLPGSENFRWLSLSTLAIGLVLASAIYWAVRGSRLVVARGLFGPKQRFHLPRRIQDQDFPVLYRDQWTRYIEPEHLALLEDRMRADGLSPSERHRQLRRMLRARQPDVDDEDPGE